MRTEILEPNQGKELRIYAIWFNMFFTDSRDGWPAELLDDERVRHFWDDEKVVGTWYGEHITQKQTGHIEWDAFFLYGPDAEWGDSGAEVLSWGRTIVSSRESLREKLSQIEF